MVIKVIQLSFNDSYLSALLFHVMMRVAYYDDELNVFFKKIQSHRVIVHVVVQM